jgi:hypothetical protein
MTVRTFRIVHNATSFPVRMSHLTGNHDKSGVTGHSSGAVAQEQKNWGCSNFELEERQGLSSAFDDTKISLCGLVEHFEGWPVQFTFIRGYRLL